MPVTDWQSSPLTVMPAVVVSIKFPHSGNWISGPEKIIVCEYCGRILIDKYICDYDGSMQKADLESALESQKKKGRKVKKTEE